MLWQQVIYIKEGGKLAILIKVVGCGAQTDNSLLFRSLRAASGGFFVSGKKMNAVTGKKLNWNDNFPHMNGKQEKT